MKCESVSVITVVKNAVDTIEQTILSVLGQSYKNIEYIIVDGVSNDGTLNVINKYKNEISIVISETDNGIYDAMNKGILASKGDIIAFLNADDWYDKTAIEQVVNTFAKTECRIAYGNIMFCDGDNYIKNDFIPLKKMWIQMAMMHPSTFISRELFDLYGNYDTSLRLAADYDLLLRFYEHSPRISYIDAVLAYFRTGGRSFSNCKLSALETIKVSLRHIDRSPYPLIVKNECKRKLFQVLCEYEENKIGEYLSELIEEDECISIWGCGWYGSRIAEALRQNKRIIDFYIDSDSNKWGNLISDGVISSPDTVIRYNGTIIITAEGIDDQIDSMIRSRCEGKVKVIRLSELRDTVFEQYMENDSI